MRFHLYGLVAVIFGIFLSIEVNASDYPNKSIRLIIPFPPGGGNDIVGRIIGVQLANRLGKQVVIDNRSGAGGVIGSEMAANSQPDGYTLLVISATYTVNPWLYKLTFDPLTAFAPISRIASSPNVLIVQPLLPIKSVEELIALAKAKPGQLNYASGGVGSNPHLSFALFSSLAGIKTVHIPFRGSGPMVMDVISGQSQFGFAPIMASLPHLNSGRLRGIATSGATRSPVLPNMPTVSESGVANYESSNWWGIVAPFGLSKNIQAKLHEDIMAVLKSSETRKWSATEGAVLAGDNPEKFGKHIAAELKKWGKVVHDFDIRLD